MDKFELGYLYGQGLLEAVLHRTFKQYRNSGEEIMERKEWKISADTHEG